MKFKYVGNGDSDPVYIKFMGAIDFKLNEVTEVEDPYYIGKLRGNGSFELVDGEDKPQKVEVVKEEPVANEENGLSYMDKIKAITGAGIKLENRSKAWVDEAYEKMVTDAANES